MYGTCRKTHSNLNKIGKNIWAFKGELSVPLSLVSRYLYLLSLLGRGGRDEHIGDYYCQAAFLNGIFALVAKK